MPAWLLGKLLAPFFFIAVVMIVGYPVRRLIERRMREGWLKRLLLRRIRT